MGLLRPSFFERNPLYTTEEVAQYLKVDVVTVRRMVARGELPARRIANEYRFTADDLRKYLDSAIVRPSGTPSAEDRGAREDARALAEREDSGAGGEGERADGTEREGGERERDARGGGDRSL